MFVQVVFKSVQVFQSIISPGNMFQSVAALMVKRKFLQFEVGLLRYHFFVICPCVTIIQFEHDLCSFWAVTVVPYFEDFDHC